MITLLLGLVLGLTIGFLCRWLDIPLPAPPSLVGALLVVSMTLGYLTAGTFLPETSTVHPDRVQVEGNRASAQ